MPSRLITESVTYMCGCMPSGLMAERLFVFSPFFPSSFFLRFLVVVVVVVAAAVAAAAAVFVTSRLLLTVS